MTKQDSLKERLTRGGTGRTIIKLVIASIIVGAVFSFLGIGVREFWSGVFENVKDAVGMLGESFGEIALTVLTYLLIGAGIVVPIWLVMRLLSSRK
ncbi:DUF6460 domain-containing protein [Hyphococcus luteus]|nr:DUF6460 domain-containing protein [Marinicaulis flavus]